MSNNGRAPGKSKQTPTTRDADPDFTSSAKSHRHHHHRHLPHRRQEKHLVSQPSTQPNVAIEEARSERMTPRRSQDDDRRWNLLGPGAGSGSDEAASVRRLQERRVVEDAELNEAREKGVLRSSELRNLISELSSISHNTTRRLDVTYYSVLEKLSALQATIVSLKELVRLTQDLNEDFHIETAEVIHDVETQLEAFGAFETQQKKIANLSERVHGGRAQIQVLSQRVNHIREQMAYWDKAEAEWKANTRKRIQGLWLFITIVGLSISAFVVFFYYMPSRAGSEAFGEAGGLGHPLLLPEMAKIRNETTRSEGILDQLRESSAGGEAQDDGGHMHIDARLRLLDEL